jgi:hypothetical protein
VLLETEPDTERRENVSAARFRDTESHTAGVGLKHHTSSQADSNDQLRICGVCSRFTRNNRTGPDRPTRCCGILYIL